MGARDDSPRTVLPPRAAGAAPRPGAELYDRLAEPVIAYADRLATVRGEDLGALLRQAGVLLDRFATDAGRAGAIASTIPPAKYALALILDAKARENRAIEVQAWASGAHRYLFDGREITQGNLREFIRIAGEAGHDFDGVRRFLERCLARLQGERQKFDRSTGSSWTGIFVVLVTAFVMAVVGWAGYVEWKYNHELSRVFADEALAVGLDRDGSFPDLAARLDRLRAAEEQVGVQAEKSPVRLFAGLFGYDAARNAREVYAATVARHLPAAIARALDDAFASEGDPVILYDAIRAQSVLSGQAPWSPAYLAGWLHDRALVRPDLRGLAAHARVLSAPAAGLPPPDPELLDQARAFAAEAPEPDRAYVELLRSDGVAGLTDWVADAALPGLSDILQRKSGLPVSEPVPALFTARGWDHARDFGAGLAVQTARAEAARLFATPPPTRNDTPDLILDRLQKATLATWSAWLADLRVKPFSDPETSVLVSGRLAERSSPIEALLRAVWNEAGGNDRKRTQAQQLSVATTFGPAIQYVEQGRIAEISALFASLNVALGAMDRDEETGLQRLMSVTDRAQSIAALRQAPLVVVQIVEDVLAQTGQSHADLLTNPLTKAWQTEALAACKAATEGRFPFADSPQDADLAAVQGFFGPGGTIDRFYAGRVEKYLDTSASPWRWKPEARFDGLTQDSAAFFQRARAIGAGLFAGGAAGTPMTLAALAERGKAFMSVGGQGGPVEATSDSLTLSWPGAQPEAGVDISFTTPEGQARLGNPGIWGLYRLLAPLRLRERDEGRRFLVDLRSGSARLFLEIGFPEAANPLSLRDAVRGFACPAVL